MPHDLPTFAKEQASRGIKRGWVCLVNQAEQTKQAYTCWPFPSFGFLMKVLSTQEQKQSFVPSFNIHQAPIPGQPFFPARSLSTGGQNKHVNRQKGGELTRWWELGTKLWESKPFSLGLWRSLTEEVTLKLGFRRWVGICQKLLFQWFIDYIQ